ncbi:helix-hairpin-helix domain-containing protein [Streptomyces sp. NPDC020917]|uniref:helix-hairpin-helix domain-containing protein n=1 Tax=Streptomyces sp. NPDC020917 TaxID=3365102 RepID=UPI0037903C66
MNGQSVIDRRDRTTSGHRQGLDRAALTRERAAALFGRPRLAGEGPPGPAGGEYAGFARAEPGRAEPGPAEPRLAEPLPGVPVFGEGPVGRLRAWLFVRCGLEFRTVVALAVVLVVAVGLAVQHYWAGRPHAVRVPPPAPTAALPRLATPRPAAPPQLTVDVAGKVAKPGLRLLPKGSRVADALTAAGGPLPGADTTTLNLARPLTDGEQILVGIPAPAAAAAPGDPAAAATPLSLNSATPAQLDALPGVGPVLAQHIIDFRTQHGGFTSLQQLHQIPGIGPRKFTTLQPLVHP